MMMLNPSWRSESRRVIDLNPAWDFVRRRVGSRWLGGEGGGERVHLPHDWNATEEFRPGVRYYQGQAAYRRALTTAPLAPDRRRILSLGGFYGWGTLWVDGVSRAPLQGNYLGSEVDLTDALTAGEHQIGIRLTNAWRRNVLPGLAMPDFLLYGGLAGGCRCVEVASTHLDDAATWAVARALDTPDARLELCTAIVTTAPTTGDRGHLTVTYVWYAPDGTEQARGDLTPEGERFTARMPLPPDAPRWSCATPHRHVLRLALQRDGMQIDDVLIPVGLRTLEFRAREAFYLNGERLPLRGANRHESLAGFGHALPAGLHRHDAEQLKAMGLNFVRLAHYPQSPAFLDACDELGLLLYAEIATWKSVRGGRWLEAARGQLRHMIQRDRHHPGIILWGLGNESRHRRAYRALDADARQHDPEARATIYAENHLYRALRKGISGLTDVWGINYETEVLAQALPRARCQCALISEAANLPYARRGHRSAEWEQLELAAQAVRAASHPGLAGLALWSFADYATLRKQRYLRHCGLLDAWRAPKMAAAWLAAQGRDTPQLHLFADWGLEGQSERRIYVLTNAERVRDVRETAWHPVEGGRATWVVTHDGEPLRIVAGAGAEDDAVTCEATLDPWSRGAALAVTVQPRVGGDPDIALLMIRVIDAEGRAVHTWNGTLALQRSEGVRAACLGGDQLPIRGGSARIYLWREPGAPATTSIILQAEGLCPHSLEVAWPH